MGKRTHQHKIPIDAIYIDGKPWTRLMIMRYTGLSAHKYKEYTKERDPENLLRWGAWAYRTKIRKTYDDKSRPITLDGITLTVRQWFALAVRDMDLTKLTYSEFQSRIGYYKRRANQSETVADKDALSDTLRSMGMENLPNKAKRIKENPDLWAKFESTYLDRINEYQQGIKDGKRELLTEEPPHPNKRWFECLLADTRLHWLFYQEYEKEIAVLLKERDDYKQANINLQNELAFAVEQKNRLERQLADFRRSTAVGGFTQTT